MSDSLYCLFIDNKDGTFTPVPPAGSSDLNFLLDEEDGKLFLDPPSEWVATLGEELHFGQQSVTVNSWQELCYPGEVQGLGLDSGPRTIQLVWHLL